MHVQKQASCIVTATDATTTAAASAAAAAAEAVHSSHTLVADSMRSRCDAGGGGGSVGVLSLHGNRDCYRHFTEMWFER